MAMRFLFASLMVAATMFATPAYADQPVAAFLGDSYTAAYGIEDHLLGWPTIVAQAMRWQEKNFGRGGTGYLSESSYGPSYRNRLGEVAAVNPNVVVVAGGVNDQKLYATNPGAVAQAVADTYSLLREAFPNTQIIAVGPTFLSDVTPDLIALDQDVENAARVIGAQYVSMIWPTYVLRPDMFLGDALHVDEQGHQAIAERILSAIRRQ